MRKFTQNLRVNTDRESPTENFTPTAVSFNRTPPLSPPTMASPQPSRSVTPFSDPRSDSRQSDPFSDPDSTPKRGRLARLKQSLKDNWEAGTDPKGFHEKRHREASSSPGASGYNSRSNSRDPMTRVRTSDNVTSHPSCRGLSRTMTDNSKPSQPDSRGPSRATDRSVPSQKSTLSRNASKKAKDEKYLEKEASKLERQQSQRQKVKYQRAIERGDYLFSEDTGSPRHAPLHLLGEANEARTQAEALERLKLKRDWERRRSEEERMRAHAPAGFMPKGGKGEAYGKNPYERIEPSLDRSSSQRRDPEYDKHTDEPTKAQAYRDAVFRSSTKASHTSAAQPTHNSIPMKDPFQGPFHAHRQAPLSPPASLPKNDINPYHWSGIEARTPSPHTRSPTSSILSKYLDEHDREGGEDPFASPVRQKWSSPPQHKQSTTLPEPPLYWQPPRSPVVDYPEYNPYAEWPPAHPIQKTDELPNSRVDESRSPAEEYNPYEWTPPRASQRTEETRDGSNKRRGEVEKIINRMVMPDEERARQERDLYHAHVTRRRGEAAGREFF